ncbi:hypothetical protein GTA08_BOTSDO10650 [Neofusicoccum parvum]|uniref:Uncharacterized protein n=1 Tax=Neofusicoccum parvum TaxID=310453 RepID=A0ACB5SDJ8_9PEZI|nr:hypothetical protein GTA08_BOTSDO10650 [Neofusicoccum parvum]
MSHKIAPTLFDVINMAPSKPKSKGKLHQPVPQDKSLLHTLLNSATDVDAPAKFHQHDAVEKLRSPGAIIRSYLDTADLLSVRLACKPLKNWIEQDITQTQSKIFETLHVNRHFTTNYDKTLSLGALQTIAPFCKHLVIHLGSMIDHSPTQLYRPDIAIGVKQSAWMYIFALLGGLVTLTISAPGEPDWHTFGSGEAQLESIRVAVETMQPLGLRTITLSPINAMGLVHFRWRGAAFQETTWMAGAFWGVLTNLTLDLLNPLPHYHKSNRKDFIKTLHDFLGSFSQSLQVFRFSWVGPAGPNPLLLDLRYGGHNFSPPGIKWRVLEDVVLKNVLAHDGDLVSLRRTRCNNLRHFKLEEEEVLVEKAEMVVWEDESDDEVWEDKEPMIPRENSPFLFSPFSL